MIVTREQGTNMVKEAYAKYKAIAVYYATGFGKTKAALDSVSKEWGYEAIKDSGLIVCHTETSRDDTWPTEIKKWFGSDVDKYADISFTCYQSLDKYIGQKFKWVILDEAHYLTPNYYSSLQRISYDGIVLLTATEPEDPYKRELLHTLSKGHTLKIELDDAVKSKVLNDYRIRMWEIELTASEWSEYVRLSKLVQTAAIQGNDFMKKKYGGDRMRFIYNCETKLKGGIYLRDKIRETGKRFAIFAGSIATVEKLTPYVMHSGVSDRDFKRFCAGEINEIGSIKQIQEGANIPRLESSLIQQLNSKQLKMIQTVGRNMRLDPTEVAIIHVLVAKNTVDQNWAESAMKGFDKSKITRHRILHQDIQNIQI